MQNNVAKKVLLCFSSATQCKLSFHIILILRIKLTFTWKISAESQYLNTRMSASNDGDFSNFSMLASMLPTAIFELSSYLKVITEKNYSIELMRLLSNVHAEKSMYCWELPLFFKVPEKQVQTYVTSVLKILAIIPVFLCLQDFWTISPDRANIF